MRIGGSAVIGRAGASPSGEGVHEIAWNLLRDYQPAPRGAPGALLDC